MKIYFNGAAEEVTGSSFLVDTGDFRLLVDCGMFQGSKTLKELNYGDFPYEPKSVDAVILTHAHIDHSGLIPKLIKKGYEGPIYATPETIDLCSIMLPDSGYIQEMEIERKNRKRTRSGEPPLEPIYTSQDAMNSLSSFSAVNYHEKFNISEKISIEFVDAGHILGSSHIIMHVVENGNKQKIVFSGDIGTTGQPYIEDPYKIKDVDMIIMETTYGNRVHEDKTKRLDILTEIINDAHKAGGNIVIPAFAIERTQDLLYYLQVLQKAERIPIMPIYIDSPLAVKATRIFRNHPENFDDETLALIKEGDSPLLMDNLHFSETTEESIKLNMIEGGAIIISASGMADAGRIKHHLKHNLWKHNATVLFVGYQAQGTLGRRLVEGVKEVTIHGESITVHANIRQLSGFSAHADKNELLKWVKRTGENSKQLFLVHGEEDALQKFSQDLKQIGKEPIIPELGECVKIKEGKITRIPPEKPWIEQLEEKIAAGCLITNKPKEKITRDENQGLLLSEINESYAEIISGLTNIMEKAKKQKKYSQVATTFNKVLNIIEEHKHR